MRAYEPPFQLSHALLSQVAEIVDLLAQWKHANAKGLRPHLRRSNRIRSIQASLAIEQNTLSLEQVTAVLDGKVVLGSPREILEVRNAFRAYEALPDWDSVALDDLLAAHRLLMLGLADDAGHLRRGGVGVFHGERLVHMAPPPSQLPRLLGNLFEWLERTEAHPLIASSAFHYELEFIHPFSDGNGRIGRLWQTLILSRWQPILAYLPVETVIKDRQQAYYDALGVADEAADCSGFIAFLLDALANALRDAIRDTATQETARETTQETILRLLSAEPKLTRKQLAKRLAVTEDGVKYHLQKLQESGRLAREGSTKAGWWRVL